MTDLPIIFSAPMVRALLDGRKTMTRRLAWREARSERSNDWRDANGKAWSRSLWQCVNSGDRLWVRETLVPGSCGFDYDAGGEDDLDLSDLTEEQVEFWNKRAGIDPDQSPKVSPIHMPRWASRLTLIVTATKIERVQEISPDDAWNEGVERHSKSVRQMWLFGAGAAGREAIYKRACVWEFEQVWNTLHGPDSWDANPEVVALTFTVHKQNIDAMPRAEAA